MKARSRAIRSPSAWTISRWRCGGAKRWRSWCHDRSPVMIAETFHVALVGAPNSGKTALFNALTGSRQKVANYPGVTVERKAGTFVTPGGRKVSLVDLPGTYSLR